MHRSSLGPWSILVLLVALSAAGCSPQAPTGGSSGTSAGSALPSTAPLAKAERSGPPPFREFWEEHYFQGSKIGHTHGEYFHDVLDGEPIVRIQLSGTMTLKRSGQTIEQAMNDISWETPAGEVRKFRNSMFVAGAEQTTTGTVQNGRAKLMLETSGRSTESTLDWPAGTLGEFGIADWLARTKPQTGASGKFLGFLPYFNQIVEFVLSAKQKEAVDVGGTRRDLLRIEIQAQMPGGLKLDSVAWVDDQGEVWKSEYPAMQQTTLRTTREQALKAGDPEAAVDIGAATKVPVSPALANPYETKQVRYRVTLAGGDAAALFPAGDSQSVLRGNGGAAEIAVAALRPDVPSLATSPTSGPTDADRLPNAWVQSDAPEVVRLAATAAGTETDPWKAAVALEKSLRPQWKEQPLGTSFATAADAARQLSGDCTEYAVLLCAMLRARGIPARTAVGLVYVDHEEAFLYHMWTEAYFADRWIPLDAAWGQGGTNAAYLKIAQTNLAGVDPLSAMLSVAQVMGRLKVEVLERK
ncbi:MAG: transglutaminase domain-containing protein [Pirellulales bacterium]